MKDKNELEDLVADAVEAEADPDRHVMEEGVLATVARHGLDAGDLWQGFNGMAWSRSDFKAIAAALGDCITEGTAADPVLVRAKLAEDGARINADILTGILDGSKVQDVAVAVRYIGIMDRQDRFRRAEDAGQEFLTEVGKAKTAGRDVDAAFAGLLKNTFALAQGKRLIRENAVEAEAIPGFLKALADRRTDGRDFLGLDTGFRHLNEILNGLTEGVFILAGAPSCGKTTLVKQVADHVAAVEKVPVLFFSFEQSAEELRIKSLARLASVDSRVIWKGRTGGSTWGKIEAAAEEYRVGSGRWLTIVEAGREDTLDRIRAAAVMAKHRAGDRPVLLILDYLQILPAGPDAPDTIRERVDYHLSELRRLSRDLKSPILAVSSENRDAYKGNSRPTLAALKESGGIEYTADAVVCLWRDTTETEGLERARLREGRSEEPKTVRVKAYVLKNRNGELGIAKLDFTPAWALFEEAGKEDLDHSDALGG